MLLEQLVPNVLLGTSKKSLLLNELSPNLRHAAESAPDPETALWRALSVAVLHDQAGQCGERLALPDLPPCLPEVQPYAPLKAQMLLSELMASEMLCKYPAVAQTLLDVYVERGWILSPDHLLSACELSVDNPTLWAVIGERGKWLLALMADEGHSKAQKWYQAAQKREANYGEAAWTEGVSAARKAALERCRFQNPTLALQWLSSTWDIESSPNKLAFVQLLAIGLSVNDIAFLTQVLDSINALPATKIKPQQQELRLHVAHLLAQIPESSQHQNLCSALLACWHVGARGKIELKMPDATSDFWQPLHLLQQYGVVIPNNLPTPYSPIAYCMSALLRYVPPRLWQTHLGKSVAEWANYCIKDPKMDELAHLPDANLDAICQATLSYRDSDMAQILLQAYGHTQHVKREMAALTALLPNEVKRDLLIQLDWSKGIDLPNHLLKAMQVSSWSKTYSQAIMAKAHQKDARHWYYYMFYDVLPLLAQCLHPSVIAELQQIALDDQSASKQHESWGEYCRYVLLPLNELYHFFQKIKSL